VWLNQSIPPEEGGYKKKGGSNMEPMSGFFEYGFAAVLGAALMIGFGVWSLVTSENSRNPNSI